MKNLIKGIAMVALGIVGFFVLIAFGVCGFKIMDVILRKLW